MMPLFVRSHSHHCLKQFLSHVVFRGYASPDPLLASKGRTLSNGDSFRDSSAETPKGRYRPRARQGRGLTVENAGKITIDIKLY